MSPTVSTKTVKNQKGAKEFIKSEVELVDVCHRHIPVRDFNHREGDSQEPCIVAEGNRHREHEQHQDSSHQKEDLEVNCFQRKDLMMMKRTSEQITDLSRGNTAVIVGIEQFLSQLGPLKTVTDVHNSTEDVRHVVAKITVKSKDRRDSIQN